MNEKMRNDAYAIMSEAIAAVDPKACIYRSVVKNGLELLINGRSYDLSLYDNIYIISFGKASISMTKAMEEILGDSLTSGIAITKYGFSGPLSKVEVYEAGHPTPDDNSIIAGKKVHDFLESTGANDLILFLISGGGSALVTYPRKGISLTDMAKLTDGLIRSGATIDELNTVRKHLCSIKGGGLAKMAFPSESISLILSDVVGDPLDVIASGPTVPDTSTYGDFHEIIERYSITLSPAVAGVLEDGLEGVIEETPSSEAPVFEKTSHYLVGNNALALMEAENKASELGYNTMVLTSSVIGEAREVAKVFAAIAREERRRGTPIPLPACILAGGETTVTMKGKGLGGRCQEMALSFAIEVADLNDVLLLAAGTDGNDGTTDCAGAYADGETIQNGKNLQLDAHMFLSNNNSHGFFKETGDLIKTGPTGTNVMDIYIILVDMF
ncbi:MAG: glycerate 2-kinase [Methanolobus sp.]|jgi:hydroxypyruvate reductase/glycerate 2-kinase|uniref:Putative glycerate kinase n=1 Tax=Methanolobus tindarius DSM 2278 TaxID=1090322 RepID=W9DQD7_METTI|nr:MULTISPECIES: glycerate kinase [Methanolobus]ETA68744.1 putative glycerate kinase [Methanolobus tindarius DSM 2278]MDI3486408.1 glycerate 2-kinase [Methanolobus sp.]MDK2827041.1 glycerate 2-kinase [Methanolobus sp.]MDK2832082.1 glycerate 2-kinase [Methanolobus sp.]MDK2940198.1 glycerate 2-kinase [Methanolobus sp.]